MKLSLTHALLAALVAVTTTATGCAPHHHGAQAPGGRTITVVGQSMLRLTPDIVNVDIGAEAGGATASEATQRVNATVAEVIVALKRAGLAEADLQTSAFDVHYERFQDGAVPFDAQLAPPPAQPEPPRGGKSAPALLPMPMPHPPVARGGQFRATNTLRATIRDVARAGSVVDAAFVAGANAVYGLSFGLDKPERFGPKLRQLAVADAKSRAASLAKLHGVDLGDLVSVSEVVHRDPSTTNVFESRAAMMTKGSGSVVSPGEITLESELEVVFAIDRD